MKTMVLLSTSLFLFTGCSALFGSMGGGKKHAKKKKSPGYVGVLKIENASSHTICSIEVKTRNPKTRKRIHHRIQEKIAPKGVAQVTATEPVREVMLFGCDGVLAIHDRTFDVGTVVLADVKPAEKPADKLVLAAKPKPFMNTIATIDKYNKSTFSGAKEDVTLTQKVLAAAKAKAVASRWADTPRFARLASQDWIIYRNKRSGVVTHRAIQAYIGHDFGNDRCTVQVHLFSQQHDGKDFTGPVRYYATGNMAGLASMSCAMYDWLRTQKGTQFAMR